MTTETEIGKRVALAILAEVDALAPQYSVLKGNDFFRADRALHGAQSMFLFFVDDDQRREVIEESKGLIVRCTLVFDALNEASRLRPFSENTRKRRGYFSDVDNFDDENCHLEPYRYAMRNSAAISASSSSFYSSWEGSWLLKASFGDALAASPVLNDLAYYGV